jgi:hypothetical protein
LDGHDSHEDNILAGEGRRGPESSGDGLLIDLYHVALAEINAGNRRSTPLVNPIVVHSSQIRS